MALTPPITAPTLPGLLGTSQPIAAPVGFNWARQSPAGIAEGQAGACTAVLRANATPTPNAPGNVPVVLAFPNQSDQVNYPGSKLLVPDLVAMRAAGTGQLTPFATAGDPTTGIGEVRSYARVGTGYAAVGTLIPCYLNYVEGHAPVNQQADSTVQTWLQLTPVTFFGPGLLWPPDGDLDVQLNQSLPARVVSF